MKTAIDSNVISALWTGDAFAAECKVRLQEARHRGSLVICAPVYCELHACPGITSQVVRNFLDDTGIATDFQMSDAIWREAATRFARYANRRRKSGGASPKRMLVDFIVGAHALLSANRLLTVDQDRYARDFPELSLV